MIKYICPYCGLGFSTHAIPPSPPVHWHDKGKREVVMVLAKDYTSNGKPPDKQKPPQG